MSLQVQRVEEVAKHWNRKFLVIWYVAQKFVSLFQRHGVHVQVVEQMEQEQGPLWLWRRKNAEEVVQFQNQKKKYVILEGIPVYFFRFLFEFVY